MKKVVILLGIITVAASLMGCDSMNRRDRNTLIGAGVGGVAGNLMTGGSATGTMIGAGVGGVAGNLLSK